MARARRTDKRGVRGEIKRGGRIESLPLGRAEILSVLVMSFSGWVKRWARGRLADFWAITIAKRVVFCAICGDRQTASIRE